MLFLDRILACIPIEKIQSKISKIDFETFKIENGIQKSKNSINEIYENILNNIKSYSTKNVINELNEQDLFLCSEQNIYSYLLDDKFITKSLVISVTNNKKLWYPIKPKYQEYFRNQNIVPNRLVCTFLWSLFIVYFVFIQMLQQLYKLFTENHSIEEKSDTLNNKTIVLGINQNNIVSENGLYNFRNWFTRNIYRPDKSNEILFITSDSKKIISDTSISEKEFFQTSKRLRLTIAWKIIAVIIKKILQFNLRTTILILLNINQIHKLEIYKNNTKSQTPKELFFTSQFGVCMPLWAVYSAKKIKVNFIFLASYSEPNHKYGDKIILNQWLISCWPTIYLADAIQAKQLRLDENIWCEHLKYVELPDWIDTNNISKTFNETDIFIFDGEMQKNYFGLSTLYEYGWGNIETNILFIEDIIDLAVKTGLNAFIKPKREIKSKRFEGYQTLLNRIQSGYYPNIFILSSEVAVRKLCRNKGLVISKPFSTSGLIAREEFCESIYYDPLGNKFENDPGLRGIEVISNKDDLLKFFERKK